MKLGFVSDSLGGLPFDALLDHAARLGVSGVEVNTGGWSTAPHFSLSTMVSSATARRRRDRGRPSGASRAPFDRASDGDRRPAQI